MNDVVEILGIPFNTLQSNAAPQGPLQLTIIDPSAEYFLDSLMTCFVHKMLENNKKCPSWFPHNYVYSIIKIVVD